MAKTLFSSTEMVRLSCFNAHIHSSKPKVMLIMCVSLEPENPLSAEAMHKALEDRSDNPSSKDFTNSSGTSPLLLKAHDDILCISANNFTSSSSVEHNWKSDKIKMKYNTESDVEVNKTCMKKSQSLGSGLDRKGRVSGGNDSEDETEQGFCVVYSRL